MQPGPDQIDHASRLKIAEDIADQLKGQFKDRVMAIAIYGSLAKGTDGPYSDIEMDCVLDSVICDQRQEWIGGGWKAEIDIFSVNSILKKAAEVGPKWSISHSGFIHNLPLYDSTNLYVHLRNTALRQPDLKFRRAMRDLIVEDMFEIEGKIRNSGFRKEFTALPYYAVEQTRWGALLLGLFNRHLYSSSAKIFLESLELDSRPEGYDDLCHLVINGELSDSGNVLNACERFWAGVNAWANANAIKLIEDFRELLAREMGNI